jgi:putative component of membrane protein insertase Oxa1/YidC/SpoIIIJ protein YidD
MPSDDEQEEVWQYVCKRVLNRPDTSILRVAKYMVSFVAVDTFVALVASVFCKNYLHLSLSSLVILFLTCAIFGLLLVFKKAIIGLVKLYQHYAPDRIRRKCLFKPTCSEYMILALEKYGLIKGLYKGIYRVVFRCRGFVYSIDYP